MTLPCVSVALHVALQRPAFFDAVQLQWKFMDWRSPLPDVAYNTGMTVQVPSRSPSLTLLCLNPEP